MTAADTTPFAQKMNLRAKLTDADHAILRAAMSQERGLKAGTPIIEVHAVPSDVHVVLSGYAYRYKHLSNGSRSIVAILVPGDLCDLHGAVLDQMDHSIGALSTCVVANFSRAKILELVDEHPAIARAFWWSTLVDEAILREWVVNLGQRPGDRRVGHLFCELYIRLASVGMVRNNRFAFPLTQTHLADLTGLSNVHVNRKLQDLREAKLLSWEYGVVEIFDLGRLMAYVNFDATYLHRPLPDYRVRETSARPPDLKIVATL